MRHKNWKTYLKLACSWILILSMCFMNLETVSASEDDAIAVTEQQETEDTEVFTSEPEEQQTEQSTEEFTSETDGSESETEIPDSMEVEKLEQEIQDATASNGQAPVTKLVEYVDESGNSIEGAPETIELGKISDHSELNIADKDYEFKSAKVNGEDCVFIGVYKDALYWSTDNINANKIADGQKLTMTYALKEAGNEDLEPKESESDAETGNSEEQEKSSEQIIDPETENETEQDTDIQLPDTISVQSLDQVMQQSVANGDEQTTDRVEYVDVNGTAIEDAPTTIELGNIDDHKELTISGSGKNYEFKSARVNGKDCVYIGKYEETIYYSTDGIIAIKLEDGQKLTMTYQEYYNITIKEDIPENGVAGTITHDGKTVDTSCVVRVDAGNDWKFTITPAQANKIRYKITSVVSEKNTVITQDSGDEYGATYTAQFQKDDVITITYSSEGIYRVNVKETNNEGVDCINTDKDHYEGTYINDFTFTESDLEGIDKDTITLPVFHVISTKRIVGFQLNGSFMSDSTTRREVPVSTSNPLTVRGTTSKGVFSVQIKLIDVGILSKENGCNYGYQLIVKKISGNWDDLNFTPTYGERRTQTLTLRILTQGKDGWVRGGDGVEVAVYNYSEDKAEGLEVVHDNDVFSMNPTHGLTRKQVKFFFIKANPGYSVSIDGARTSGAQQTYPTYAESGTIDQLNANTLGGKNITNFDNNWENAKAAAEAQGYTHFLVMTGEEGNDGAASGLDWDLYVAQITAKGGTYYTMYDKGDLPDGAVVSGMPEEPDMTTSSTKISSNPYTDAPVYGPRSLGETFKVGENCAGPTCEGYKFVGWKLVDKKDKSHGIYQNNESFTIASDNVSYGNNDFCIKNSGGGLYSYLNCSYRFVAQWEKVGSKNVKVNHYLKVPDGTEVLKKTTEGTITFAEDNETVTAIAKAEPAGTFPGYIFDKDDSRNTLEKTVTNDASTDTIELNLYYKPTVLTVSKTVSGYNLEPNKSFTFTIQANAPAGTDENNATLSSDQIYIKKGTGTAELIPFTNNQATFTLKKDESVDISCLPTGWTYTVTETAPGTNFKASYKINGGAETDGAEATFTMATTGSEKIAFTNTSTVAPPVTGRDIHNSSWILMLFTAVLVSMCGMMIFRKIKR